MPDATQLARRQAFGEAVRACRTHAQLSQDELADVAQLDRTYISGIERGRRNLSLDNIWRIAQALHLNPSVLLAHAEQRVADH